MTGELSAIRERLNGNYRDCPMRVWADLRYLLEYAEKAAAGGQENGRSYGWPRPPVCMPVPGLIDCLGCERGEP